MGNLFSRDPVHCFNDRETAVQSEPQTIVLENPKVTIATGKPAFKIKLGPAFNGFVDISPRTFLKSTGKCTWFTGLNHPNLAEPLFGMHLDKKSFVVYEHLTAPLKEFIPRLEDYKDIISQLADGVEYLHDRQITGFALEPENICVAAKRDENLVVKLVDLSSAVHSKDPSQNMFEDMARLGSLFLNIFSRGSVTYDLVINSVDNILSKRTQSPNFSDILCADLIHKLKLRHQHERIEACEIKDHPFFWDDSKIVNFIIEVNKLIEKERRQTDTNFIKRLSRVSRTALGRDDNDWSISIGKAVLCALMESKKDYHERNPTGGSATSCKFGGGIISLLQAMRNIFVHYQASDVITNLMGTDELFVEYWLGKFPRLIYEVYNAKMEYDEDKPLKKLITRQKFKRR